jgi:hypothetical protein
VAPSTPHGRLLVALALAGSAIVAAALFAYFRVRIDASPAPSAAARRWSEAALRAALHGEAPPATPRDAGAYRAAGPILVSLWYEGREVFRREGGRGLERAVLDTAAAIGRDRARGGLLRDAPDALHPRITVPLGYGAAPVDRPLVRALAVVPLREGLEGRLGADRAVLTPDELLARGALDEGLPTPIPDLRIGVAIDDLLLRLARDLGAEGPGAAGFSVRRFRAATFGGPDFPRPFPEHPSEGALRAAAADGARFLLRHQRPDGRYAYVWDAARGRERDEGYNLPRHAGTSYFLAQVDHLSGMPEARAGALRALRFLERHHLTTCGAPDRLCLRVAPDRADVGTAALTVVAAAELLAKAEDATARRLVEGLTAFLRAQQRPDGELMHEYDLAAQAPIDVQRMYYSGEAAFALLKAHEVTGDARDLDAARRVMAHLTGAGWDFLGSRYYYGEEHWTCIAAGEAGERVDTRAAGEFCERWMRWNDALQFRRGETPWPVAGAYGVGPLLLPRLTPVGSRTEAMVAIYELFERQGRDTRTLRRVIERGLTQMMQWQWRPGPVHLFRDPAAALGGMPGSPAELVSRNDYVQHAGSGFLRWAERLRRERGAH